MSPGRLWAREWGHVMSVMLGLEDVQHFWALLISLLCSEKTQNMPCCCPSILTLGMVCHLSIAKVADSLCAGGYFVATVPDPSRTEECIFRFTVHSSFSLAFSLSPQCLCRTLAWWNHMKPQIQSSSLDFWFWVCILDSECETWKFGKQLPKFGFYIRFIASAGNKCRIVAAQRSALEQVSRATIVTCQQIFQFRHPIPRVSLLADLEINSSALNLLRRLGLGGGNWWTLFLN